jgi:succinate dehydrogenase/fumarate reductase cytochrome b subunit (b558 family)
MMSVATASTAAPAMVSRLSVFWDSQVGKKFVSAVTGILLFVFVVGHVLGNLQAFQGAAKFNAYALFLQNTKALIWTTRIVMLAALVLHATAGIQLYLKARAARPQAYRVPLANPATPASKTMIWTGLLTLAFIVYHLLDLTLGAALVHSGFVHGDAYLNLVNTFRSTGKVLFCGSRSASATRSGPRASRRSPCSSASSSPSPTFRSPPASSPASSASRGDTDADPRLPDSLRTAR